MSASPYAHYSNPFNRPDIDLADDARWCTPCGHWDRGFRLIEAPDGPYYMHPEDAPLSVASPATPPGEQVNGFDYETLLCELSHLGAQQVRDENYGDRVDIPTGYLRAVTISPGDEGNPTYVVNITTWDRMLDAHDDFVGETCDVAEAIALAKRGYVQVEDDMRREDEMWCSLETEEKPRA